jgi:hypothetical protein
MRFCRIVTVLLAFGITAAHATDNHGYAKGEYAVISNGLAPNKRMSLAAHGDGDLGDENFHVWLMTEPAHRKVMTLDDISSINNLDTGPDSYHAQWSADSRRASVSFRRERHAIQLNIYLIEGGRALLTSGPSLFRNVTGRNIGSLEDIRSSTSELTWTGPDRFTSSERMLVKTTATAFLRKLGAFGKLASTAEDGTQFVAFSAQADCAIDARNRYRISNIQVGKFDE